MEHITNQQEDSTTDDLSIDHDSGESQKTPKEITRTYDVALKFESRSDAIYAADMVREFQDLSLEMLQDPIVFEEAIEVVKTYQHRFRLFPSLLRKRLKGKVDKHGRNIHLSTYTQALTLAKTYLTRGRQVQKMLDIMDKDTFTQWLIFNRSFLVERRLAGILRLKKMYIRNLVLSAGRNYSFQLPVFSDFKSIPDLFDKYIEKMEILAFEKPKISSFVKKIKKLKKPQNQLLFNTWLEELLTAPDSKSRWIITSECEIDDEPFRSVMISFMSYLYQDLIIIDPDSISGQSLVPKPTFTSLPPILLVMDHRYVVKRIGNSTLINDEARETGKIELNFRDFVYGKCHLHQRIRDLLSNGVRIRIIILNNNKKNNLVRAQIVLSGTPELFDSIKGIKKVKVKRRKVLGLDVNRPSKYMLTFSEKVELPQRLMRTIEHFKNLEKTIQELGRSYEAHRLNGNKRSETVKKELNNVHGKRKELLKVIHSQSVQHIASVLISSGTEVFVIEDLNISTLNKKGALAKAVFSMPDEVDIYENAVRIASVKRGKKIKLVKLDPFTVNFHHHVDCGGKLQRSYKLNTWDIAPCDKCSIRVNTHENSAKMLVKAFSG